MQEFSVVQSYPELSIICDIQVSDHFGHSYIVQYYNPIDVEIGQMVMIDDGWGQIINPLNGKVSNISSCTKIH